MIVQIFSLCWHIFPCVRMKFPLFSLSGKSKNQIPCFPCAVATLINVAVVSNADLCIFRNVGLLFKGLFPPKKIVTNEQH